MAKLENKLNLTRDFFASAKSSMADDQGEDWSDFDFSRIRRNKKSERALEKKSTPVNLRSNSWLMFFAGAVAGIIFWLFFEFSQKIIASLFCAAPDGNRTCAQNKILSIAISTIFVGVVFAVFLTRKQIARAVLTVAATMILLIAILPILTIDSTNSVLFSLLACAFFGGVGGLFFAKIATMQNRIFAWFLLAIFLVIFWIVAR